MKCTVDPKLLIENMRERPQLWDPSQPADKKEFKKLWSQVAKNCSAPEDQVRRKWRTLKDTYHKLCVRKKSEGSKSVSWLWFNQLSFLKSIVMKRGRPKSKFKDIVCPTTGPEVDSSETNSRTSLKATASVPSCCRCNVAVADASNQCEKSEQLVTVGVQTQSDGHESRSAISSSPTAPVLSVQCKCNVSNDNSNNEFEENLTSQERAKLDLIRSLAKQEDDRDTTYLFLMSLRDPINSLSVYEQMFVRLKFLEIVTHIIQNNCERQRTPSP